MRVQHLRRLQPQKLCPIWMPSTVKRQPTRRNPGGLGVQAKRLLWLNAQDKFELNIDITFYQRL